MSSEEKCEFNITKNAQNWLKKGSRGISSEAIFSKLTGLDISSNWGFQHPLDPSDFNRCSMLLEMVPEFKADLHKMKEVSEVWLSLVENWEELESMLQRRKSGEENVPMYERMKELGC